MVRSLTKLELAERTDVREEHGAIAAQLAGATGLAGRSRMTGTHDERGGSPCARRSSLRWPGSERRIRVKAGVLQNRVRTGFDCRYESDPDHPIRWFSEV